MEAAFDKAKEYVSKKACGMIDGIAALKKIIIGWPENPPSIGTWGENKFRWYLHSLETGEKE
jgi:hypothetical protein